MNRANHAHRSVRIRVIRWFFLVRFPKQRQIIQDYRQPHCSHGQGTGLPLRMRMRPS